MRNLIYNDAPDTSWYDQGIADMTAPEMMDVRSRPAVRAAFGAAFALGLFVCGWLAAALFTAWC